jgi:hypothetical protein
VQGKTIDFDTVAVEDLTLLLLNSGLEGIMFDIAVSELDFAVAHGPRLGTLGENMEGGTL